MFTKVLVPLDNSSLAEQALPAAQSVAKSTGAAIELVYVHQPRPFSGYADAPWNAARRSSEESYVCAIADEVRSGTNVQIVGSLATGRAAEGICQRAVEVGADLIVMTSHGRTGMSRAWIGSVADGVIRQASVPVLILRPAETNAGAKTPRPSFKRVLVPLDGSAASQLTLAPAASLAAVDDGTVIIVEVVPPIPMVLPDVTLAYGTAPMIADPEATAAMVDVAHARLRAIAALLTDSGFQNIETHVVVSEFPARAILDAARAYSVDAITMTTSGRGASRVVIGSVTDKVMRATELPLLLIRPVIAEADPKCVSASAERVAVAAV